MCGIFGIISDDLSFVAPEDLIRKSVSRVDHRGPDSSGACVAPGLGLGHARLALVDLDPRSDQPFRDETGRYALVYNGEVYNFRQLRDELQAEGVHFRTSSDTEVVLQMLIRRPPEVALAALNGMFGLAFIDLATRRTILARDRFGMKPLYWRHGDFNGGRGLIFGSEIKTFAPWMTLAPDQGELLAYLIRFGGATSGRTLYAGISSLAPGQMIDFTPGADPSVTRFAGLPDMIDPDEADRLAGLGSAQVVDEFDRLMNEAVASQLFADAGMGAFCSGGVDSSLIVSIAARQKRDIVLFHANVRGPWSEIGPAGDLARHLGLPLHSVDVEERDFVTMIPRVMQHYEQPFTYHPNCPPLMMIAQLARNVGVKGLLSGEGSDELFLGYPWLGRKRLTDAYDGMVSAGLRALRAIPGFGPILVPDRTGNLPQVMALMTGAEIEADQDRIDARLADFAPARRDPTFGWSLDYLHHHLRTLLHRNDTMGMAASIEARFPFLDHGVARFGINLAGRHKLRRSPFVLEKAHPFVRDKWVVREVARRYMPQGLSQRIKVGFWTTTFQRMEAAPAFYETSRLPDLLGVSRAALMQTVASAHHDLRLRLLHADVWARVMIDGEDPEISVARLEDHVHIRGQGEAPRHRSVPRRVRPANAPI